MAEAFITRRGGKAEVSGIIDTATSNWQKVNELTIPDLIGANNFVLLRCYHKFTTTPGHSIVYADNVIVWIHYNDGVIDRGGVNGDDTDDAYLGISENDQWIQFDNATGKISTITDSDNNIRYGFNGVYKYIAF